MDSLASGPAADPEERIEWIEWIERWKKGTA
jgi:hypothetical protein